MTGDPGLTENEVAERAGVSVARVRELARLGLLGSGPDGGERPYSLGDVMRVEVAASTEAAGVSLEDLARAVTSGELSLGYLDALPHPAPLLDRTGHELAEELGVPFEHIQAAFGAFGLPLPDPDVRVREDDAFLYEAAATYLHAGFTPELLIEAARIYGDAFRHLAQYQVDLFHSRLEQPFRDRGVPESELLDLAVTAIASKTAELGPRLVSVLYTRHSEGYQIQHRVEHAELALEALGLHRRLVATPPAIVFLDLTGYTALTEQRGDEVSADLGTQLAAFVEEPTRTYGGHVVKFLGDGVELYFPMVAQAVRCALELSASARGAGLPPTHVGINAGPVVYRGGDYYGRTVNIAARIASAASADQVMVSSEVVRACEGTDLSFAAAGAFELKGVAEAADLFIASAPGP